MNKEEFEYEEKIDRISEKIEELILDAMLNALEKITERSLMFANISVKSQSDEFRF